MPGAGYSLTKRERWVFYMPAGLCGWGGPMCLPKKNFSRRRKTSKKIGNSDSQTLKPTPNPTPNSKRLIQSQGSLGEFLQYSTRDHPYFIFQTDRKDGLLNVLCLSSQTGSRLVRKLSLTQWLGSSHVGVAFRQSSESLLYIISKHCCTWLLLLTRLLGSESSNILLLCCSPGVIVTDLHKRGGQSDEQYDAVSIVYVYCLCL